jgi:hypothetical protein
MNNEQDYNFSGMDFEKYVYFSSKAKNYGIIMEPRVEDTLSTGERRVAKGDDGKLMEGIRIEFHNGMKRIEKTKENAAIIKFLRDKCEKEKGVPLNRQQLKEITKPIKMIPEDEVNKKLKEKDEEIARLSSKNKVEEKGNGKAEKDKNVPF